MIKLFGRPPSIRRALKRAQQFPLDVVLYDWCRTNDLSMYQGVDHENELKRFLCMRGCYPERDYMARGPVLDLWQTFILYTKIYEAFCEHCFGAFVHHFPETTERGKKLPRAYADFHADYSIHFKMQPPPDVWPDPAGWGDCEPPRPRYEPREDQPALPSPVQSTEVPPHLKKFASHLTEVK